MNQDHITAAHGAGTQQTRDLVSDLVGDFEDDSIHGLGERDDGAVLAANSDRCVVSTDAHVVDPPEFPGGDLGRLAVAGTVNDLAVMGATDPAGIVASLIIEQGTPIGAVRDQVRSMRETCVTAGCPLVGGDTKVMGSGEIDGLVVTTTGIGFVTKNEVITDDGLSPGDKLVVSNTVGDHGIALLAAREGFDFESPLESDVAPVNHLVEAATDAGQITAMTDPTRGGLATALVEFAEKGNVGVTVDERSIPVDETVAGAGELLGIDPKQVACEGCVVLGVSPDDADVVVDTLQSQAGGEAAAVIGTVTDQRVGRVVLDTGLGQRYLQEPSGETLPRIC
jgi:hydrogenase expression/formation protein HypE